MTPAPPNQPGWHIESARSCRIQPTRHIDHVVAVVALSQPRAKKHPTQVYVIGHICSVKVRHLYTQISFQDFNRHSSLLLPDPNEGVETSL
jgi:hypothetical protein